MLDSNQMFRNKGKPNSQKISSSKIFWESWLVCKSCSNCDLQETPASSFCQNLRKIALILWKTLMEMHPPSGKVTDTAVWAAENCKLPPSKNLLKSKIFPKTRKEREIILLRAITGAFFSLWFVIVAVILCIESHCYAKTKTFILPPPPPLSASPRAFLCPLITGSRGAVS